MTLEEDFLSVIQSALTISGVLLFFNTINLWSGIFAGGSAKTQAWIEFSNDPITILSIIVCLGSIFFFWTFALLFGWFEAWNNQASD